MTLLRVIAAVLLTASCGDRTPPASSSVPPTPTPTSTPTPTPTPAPDAAGVADAALAAAPDAAVAVDYRVRLSGPNRVATVLRDGACAGPQASCRTEACFAP